MQTLTHLKLEELMFIKKIVESNKLQEELNKIIEMRQNESLCAREYQSGRLPEFYEEYQEECYDILSKIGANDVDFLYCSYINAGNNAGGDFRITHYKRGNLTREEYYKIYTDLSCLEDFFNRDPMNIYLYEGVYNTLNYIKTSICSELRRGKVINNKDDLFAGYEEKQEIITKAIREISKELLMLRIQVPNSRLSVCNQGLYKMSKKTSEAITKSQEHFINAVAFGSSLENLKESDYSEAKRLLFVPQEKK